MNCRIYFNGKLIGEIVEAAKADVRIGKILPGRTRLSGPIVDELTCVDPTRKPWANDRAYLKKKKGRS